MGIFYSCVNELRKYNIDDPIIEVVLHDNTVLRAPVGSDTGCVKHLDLAIRRQFAHAQDQRRKQHHGKIVVHANAENLRVRGRIEHAARDEHMFAFRHDLAHARHDALAGARHLQARRGAVKQLVFKDSAQPLERMAHGRLRKADHLSCSGKLAFGRDGVEDLEQIQINGIQGRQHVLGRLRVCGIRAGREGKAGRAWCPSARARVAQGWGLCADGVQALTCMCQAGLAIPYRLEYTKKQMYPESQKAARKNAMTQKSKTRDVTHRIYEEVRDAIHNGE